MINGIWVECVDCGGKKTDGAAGENFLSEQESHQDADYAQKNGCDFRGYGPVKRQEIKPCSQERQKRRAAEIRMQITCAVGRHRLVPAVGGNGKAVALVKLFRNVPVLIAVVMKKLMRQTDQSVNSWHHAGNHEQTESRDQDFPVVFQRAFLQKRI